MTLTRILNALPFLHNLALLPVCLCSSYALVSSRSGTLSL